MAELQAPGFWEVEPQPFWPFHRHQRSGRAGFLLLLKKQFISGSRVLQAVEIEVHQLRCPLGVVLRQGKGGTGDRLGDGQTLGQTLNKRCFAGP